MHLTLPRRRSILAQPLPMTTPPAYADLLDAESLERLRTLDPDGSGGLLERVLRTFRGSLERLIPQMRDGRHAGDAIAVRHVAHTLKSSSASVGALRLSQLCAEVEQALRQGGAIAGVDSRLDDLLAEAQRVSSVLPTDGEGPR